jgi:hypothetical protein
VGSGLAQRLAHAWERAHYLGWAKKPGGDGVLAVVMDSIENPRPRSPRCAGTTLGEAPCLAPALRGHLFCRHHLDQGAAMTVRDGTRYELPVDPDACPEDLGYACRIEDEIAAHYEECIWSDHESFC